MSGVTKIWLQATTCMAWAGDMSHDKKVKKMFDIQPTIKVLWCSPVTVSMVANS